MAIRRTTMASVSHPTSSASISQPSNTVHSSGNRSGTTSRSSTTINNSGRTAPANQNTNNHVPTGAHTASGAASSTSTSKSGAVATAGSSAQPSVNNGAADSKGVSVSIHSSNTIVRNDSGSVAVNPAATAELNSSARHETGDFSTIHTVSEAETEKTFAQNDTGRAVAKEAFADAGEAGIRNLTDQLHRRDRSSANVEKLRAEGMPIGSKRNRPVFTGESVYSINSKRTKKNKIPSWKDVFEELEDFPQNCIWNITLLGIFNNLRKENNISSKVITRHREHNLRELKKSDIYKDGEIINNQKEWENIKFGMAFDMAFSGCEIIATYNARIKLGENLTSKDLVKMISAFETDGAMMDGGFGVAPTAIQDYLIKQYKNNDSIGILMYIPSKNDVPDKEIDKIGKKNDVFIATVYNNKDKISDQIHTVCISKEDDGSYSVYNAFYQNENNEYVAKEGYESLSDAIDGISKKNPKLICLIAIDDKKN